jgi:DNA-binding MarR family transcriptional regulator
MNKTPRIGFEIRTISNLIKREVDHLEEKTYEGAISGTNRYILLHLANNRDRDIFQKDLEEVFLVRRSTMSSILLRMEEKGLLTRTSVDHDARLKKITLTEKGLRLHKQMEHSIDEMEDRLSSGLSPEESKTLLALLEKVRHNLEHEKS